jgi:hypothetical protein
VKGISHFSIGVALASCVPGTIAAGAQGNPLYFILGGVFGLLPDTVDFRIARYLYKHDVEVAPDPDALDPGMVARALSDAVQRAHDSARPVTVKLHTAQVGADAWQSYRVRFRRRERRVEVGVGPVVDTGQVPLSAPTDGGRKAGSALGCGVRLQYEAETVVDIFDGPVFRMVPRDDGTVLVQFIPWHRQWSHSLSAVLLAGLGVGALLGATAGLVAGGALLAHVLADQLGHMGSSLLYPWSRRRIEGLKWAHSGDAFSNIAAVWLSCLLVFWNLYRATPGLEPLHPVKPLAFGVLLPAAVPCLWRWWGNVLARRRPC